MDCGNSTALRIAYANGPLTVAAATETTKLESLGVSNIGAAQSVDFTSRSALALSDALSDRKRNVVGAAYDLGVAKVGFTSTQGKAGSSADAGKYSINTVGVSVPMGATTLNATMDNGSMTDSGATSVDINAYQLSAYYALSKRTNLYAIAGQVKNKGTSAKDSQYAVGVRHQF